MPPAVAYFGYVFARTGYGTAARSLVYALDAVSTPLSVVNLGRLSPRGCEDPVIARYWKKPVPPDFYLWHTEPQEAMKIAGSRQLIVMTTWEANRLPDFFVEALNRAREVWVPSRFNREHFQQQLAVPVFQLPHALAGLARPRFDRRQANLAFNFRDEDFVFLAQATWQPRKNLAGVVEAFLQAFPRESEAILAIKTSLDFSTAEQVRADLERAVGRAGTVDREQALRRVRILPLLWPEDVLVSLAARADCQVSLSHGEGWCYPLCEAAAAGTPVVATGWSGAMDFLDGEHHGLVDFKLVETPADTAAGPRFAFGAGMHWAEPDLEHAATLMRRVYEDRREARRRAAEAAPAIRERYSLEAVGRQAAARLSELAVG